VTEKAGAEHFDGVNVQPFAKLEGYEVILGSSLDPQFGPVILFGMGGSLVEVFKDRGLALPPLNSTLARRLMERAKIFTALKGVRGRPPVDIEGLEALLVRFSQLVVEQPWIKEIDINPLLASPERLLALDARVVLHDPDTTPEDLPNPHPPLSPQYEGTWQMKDGESGHHPADPSRRRADDGRVPRVALRADRVPALPPGPQPHPAHRPRATHPHLLHRLRPPDGHRGIERKDPQTGKRSIIGVGRLQGLTGTAEAEYAIVVTDQFQRRASAPNSCAASSTSPAPKASRSSPPISSLRTPACRRSAKSSASN
jgi:acetyltransferase